MTNPNLERLLELHIKYDNEEYQYFQEYYNLKEKIEKALEHNEVCNAFVLTGKDAEVFEEYNKREPTQKEIQSLKEADEYYKNHSTDNQHTEQDRQNEEIVKRLNERKEYLKKYGNSVFESKYVKDVIQELQSILGEK